MTNGDSQLREFGRFRLDVKKRVLWCGDQPVNLPLKEIELLSVLTEHSGQVITKDEIIDRVWADSFVEESNLTRHIYLLRKTLKEYGESEDLIQTVPRRGYRFTGKVSEPSLDELVIEKHTSTRTLIDVQDEPGTGAKALPAGQVSKRGVALVAVAGVVMLVGLAFLWNLITAPEVAAGPEIRSIAVLPVRSFSDSSNDEELRVRLTDALITRLGGLDKIAVRPTSAVLPFARSEEDSIELGKKLQVDAVLDSRLQQEGDRLRVTMQLVRVGNGENLWSEQFDGQADQILNLQDSIAAKVSRSLSTAVSDPAAFAKRPTENSEAYEAYLKGRYFWSKRDAASLRRAADYFQQAATMDPRFSEAFSSLADTQHLLFNYNIDVRPEVVTEAKENLRRALELKPDSSDALITLGTIEMGYDWDWKKAETTLKHAVSTAPNSPTAHMRYGALLVRIRRFDEAQAEFQRHIELDPLSVSGITNLGLTLFCKRDYAAAEHQYRKAMELDEKGGAAHWLLSRNMWLQGRNDESVAEIVQALELDGNASLAGKIRDKARSATAIAAIELLLHEWRLNPPGTNPHNLAYLSTYINDTDKAIHWLQRSIDEHHPWTSWIAAAPEFEVLRGDQRYLGMLQNLKLP
jgi:DNA-binding winged helix-turn-helix (wHTH) protein/TolB-like protein/Tfp pilus assembly protein PilF